MSTSAARRSIAPLSALVLACTGCSGGSLGPASGPQIEELADLQVLCEDIGDGYPEGAEYTGEGPHPPAMFFESPDADTDTNPGPHLIDAREDAESDSTPIQAWFPQSPEEASLLVCAEGHGKGERLHTCEYDGEGPGGDLVLPLYSQDFSVTVYELATGDTVHESEFTSVNGHFVGSGLTTDCPSWLQYETLPSELYAQPSALEIHEELGPLVEGEDFARPEDADPAAAA